MPALFFDAHDALTFDNKECTLLSKVEATSETTVMTERADLLQGTLDLLILKSLLAGPLHGWAVSKRIRDGRATFSRSTKARSTRRSTVSRSAD